MNSSISELMQGIAEFRGPSAQALAAAGDLRQLGFEAMEAAIRAAEALYKRESGEDTIKDVSLLSRVGQTLVEILAEVDDVPRFADNNYPQHLAYRLGQAVAVGIHIRCHYAFATGANKRRPTVSAMLQTLQEQERWYESALAASRSAAIEGDLTNMSRLLCSVIDQAHTRTARAVDLAARMAGSRNRIVADAGLRASWVARRMAMLAAALVVVEWRQRRSRTLATTREIAQSRSLLYRSFMRSRVTRRSLRGFHPGSPASLIGRIEQIGFVQRPTEPFSRAILADTGEVLVVPHRSITRQGVGVGTFVWATGTVRHDASIGNHLKVGFNGPGTHRMTHWEDWLADLVRPAYNLYPGTMALEWEFPPLFNEGRRTDLYIRIT
jgi:hypothetical protein